MYKKIKIYFYLILRFTSTQNNLTMFIFALTFLHIFVTDALQFEFVNFIIN